MVLDTLSASEVGPRPGDALVFNDGTFGRVTAAWSGTVVYDGPSGESTLHGNELARFIEVKQGRWIEQTEEQLRQLAVDRARHVAEYEARLIDNFLNAEEYLQRPELSTPVRHALEARKIDYIRSWVASYSRDVPDIEQATAIGAVVGDFLVAARAGSGKTATLVNRALFLMNQCLVPPEKILLLAFNKKAALQIRRKILAALDKDLEARVQAVFEDKLADNMKRKGRLDPIDLEASALDGVISKSGISLPHAMTFHALAYRIVHPTEQILFDEKDGSQSQSRAVQEIIDAWLAEPDRQARIRQVMLDHFRQDWDYIVQKGYDRDSPSFLEHRRSIINETLNGEYVKSYGEKVIADFLFEHDVPYKYERNFRRNGVNYKPDFTVFPKASGIGDRRDRRQIVIEYFGLEGDPDYDEMSREKRAFWRGNDDAVFIEYSPRDFSTGGREGFLRKLKKDLSELGLPCIRLSEDEIWERAKKRVIDSFTKAVKAFVGRCRKLALRPDEVDALIAGHSKSYETELRFYEVASGIYSDYLERLKHTGEEDFDGLILRAVDAIRSGKTAFSAKAGGGDLSVLEHISVDEYQDFSELFYRLLKATRDVNPGVKLFCVGDDWQAINSFAGSDLRFFKDFETYFPDSRRLRIATNYRSSGAIVALGNTLMQGLGDPSQVYIDDPGSVEVADLAAFVPTQAEGRRFEGDEITPAVLRLIYRALEDGQEVVVIARRNGLPYYFVSSGSGASNGLEAFERSLKRSFSSDDHHRIDVSTAHSYKGLEKHKVIVVDGVDRSYPLIHPNWVFSRLFGDTLDEVVAAERRLFYVAITRAINDLVIVTEEKRPSKFLVELGEQAPLDWLNWDSYEPAPSQGGGLHICLRNGPVGKGTFPVKDQIKACGYRWFSGSESHWRRTVTTGSFHLEKVKEEPWCTLAESVYVFVEDDDGEAIALYLVDRGEWSVLKDSLQKHLTGT